MFTCHLWTQVDQLAFQGSISVVILPSTKGPTRISADYCPIVVGLVKGIAHLYCSDGAEKKIPIAGGVASITDHNILILPKITIS